MLDDIAREMAMVTRKLNLMKLKKASVLVFTNSKVIRIDGSKIYFIQTNGTDKEQKIDGVYVFMVATEMKPNKDLIEKLEGKIQYYIIGDADKIGDAVSAIQSGYFIAKEL